MKYFCFIALFGCAQKLPQGGQRIEGRVVLGGAADFSGAEVYLDGQDTQLTGAYGDFVFEGAIPGPHIVSARAAAATLEEEVATAVVVNTDAVSGVMLTLTEVAAASGRITDTSGVPIADARVFAAGTAAVTFSQSDGRYVLDRIPAGTRTMVVSAAGFVTQMQTAVALLPSPTPVALDFALAIDTSPPLLADNHPPLVSDFSFVPSPPPATGPQPIPVMSIDASDLVHAGAALTLSVTASDPDGDALTYLWSADKGQLDGSTGPTAQWIPTSEAAEVVVIVVDVHGGATSIRHDFLPPPKSIRGATLYGDEVIYSEGRTASRDIVSFDLVARNEASIDSGAEEQSSPRVAGDFLIYADQVFTLVEPTVFQVHVRGFLDGTDALFGADLSPDGFIDMDFNLDTALSGSGVTYDSSNFNVAPIGLGVFDVPSQTFQPSGTWLLGANSPTYPCLVALGAQALGVVGTELRVYSTSAASTHGADLPANDCIEMQADGDWVAIRQTLPSQSLTLANWLTGEVRQIGTVVDSFALHGNTLAYSDFRSGFSGVYFYDVSSGEGAAVPLSGPQTRRVLELSDKWLVYGEQQQIGSASALGSQSLWVVPR